VQQVDIFSIAPRPCVRCTTTGPYVAGGAAIVLSARLDKARDTGE